MKCKVLGNSKSIMMYSKWTFSIWTQFALTSIRIGNYLSQNFLITFAVFRIQILKDGQEFTFPDNSFTEYTVQLKDANYAMLEANSK